jgi:hypothetical protein
MTKRRMKKIVEKDHLQKSEALREGGDFKVGERDLREREREREGPKGRKGQREREIERKRERKNVCDCRC